MVLAQNPHPQNPTPAPHAIRQSAALAAQPNRETHSARRAQDFPVANQHAPPESQRPRYKNSKSFSSCIAKRRPDSPQTPAESPASSSDLRRRDIPPLRKVAAYECTRPLESEIRSSPGPDSRPAPAGESVSSSAARHRQWSCYFVPL